MAPHSSTCAWKIPWTEEPSRVQSMGSQRVGQWGGCIVLVFDLAAVARSESLSWNRAWGQGSPGAPGGSGQCAGSAPGAGLIT